MYHFSRVILLNIHKCLTFYNELELKKRKQGQNRNPGKTCNQPQYFKPALSTSLTVIESFV